MYVCLLLSIPHYSWGVTDCLRLPGTCSFGRTVVSVKGASESDCARAVCVFQCAIPLSLAMLFGYLYDTEP